MTLLSSTQRAIVCIDTGLHPILLDRCVEALDALVDRGDVETYTRLMSTAYAQMGLEGPVRQQDRPTSLDVAKTIVLRAYADREHISYKRAVVRIMEMMR